jgi:hypothetical protein
MATRVVDTSSTFENWRQRYNDLATDVGSIGNLVTGDKSSVVNAINYLQDQYFFFQDFDYDGSDGATSNTVYSGADNGGNTLSYASGKVLVFKNGALLRSGTDYTAVNGTSVTLASSANNGDVIRITSFTGSYQGVGGAAGTSGTDQWLLSGGILYNKNTDGIIFNADSTINNSLDVSNSLQFENVAYFKDDVYVNAQKDIRFRDADSSHYVAIQAPTTVSANVTLTLPSDDGTASQFLQTDGSGALTWATALTSAATANDITVSANNSTNETVYPVFVDGATGAQGIESDTGLTYNPSSGTLTSTTFVGALTGNVAGNASGTAATVTGGTQSSITTAANLVTVGTIGTGVWQGTAINQTYLTGQSGTNTGDQTNISGSSATCSGLAGSATILATGRTIAMSGDVVWSSGSFNGSGNVTAAATIQTDAVDIAMLSASGTASSSTFLRGDNSWVTPTDTTTNYYLTGVTKSSNTLTFAVSGASNPTYEFGANAFNSTAFTTNTGDITAVTAGTYMSGGGTSGGVTLNHSDTSSQASVDSSGRTYIQDVTLDGAGHVTGLTTATETVTDTTYGTGNGVGLSGTNFTWTAGANLTTQTNGGSLDTEISLISVTCSGDVTANTSDVRLKDIQGTIDSPLEALSKINGYYFKWNDKAKKLKDNVFDDEVQVGVTAQEIREVIPSAVKPSYFDGYDAVHYEKIVPLLIESIKELKTELDELKSSNS